MRKPIVFLPFLVLTLLSCFSRKSQVSCKDFHEGRFECRIELDGSVIMIERNDSIQTETDTKTNAVIRSRIKWTSDCTNELTYLDETRNPPGSIHPLVQTRTVRTAILKTGKDYCIFRSTMDGVDMVLIDTLKLIK